MKYILIQIISLLVLAQTLISMPLKMSKEDIIRYTPEWKGERFSDGRPKVPDGIIERMKNIDIEAAWVVLRNEGYDYQFEGGWKHVHPGETLCGRAMTVQYMPLRKVTNEVTNEIGDGDGRIGDQVSWPIDMLVQGDIYVADVYNRHEGGPIIGASLGTSIFSKSGNGVLFNGVIRDLEQLERIEGFNAFVRDWNPGFYWASMITGINVPINIGNVVVMPGDIILGKREGVLVIPPHLAEKAVKTAELIKLRDAFGFDRLKADVYTPGQIDDRWTDEIEKDFSGWLEDHMDQLPVPKELIQELLKERTW
ncbi:MAG: dimethylmenaquinone methyltransferase [Opitutaceae bacterium]|nr:dimethylmenaquinone methyltransferase [Opitutaceae bacterium]|tara:strand:+ start:12101 stop:13027 length:927 start_codon:yes stop_codon:yes gene_type:complete